MSRFGLVVALCFLMGLSEAAERDYQEAVCSQLGGIIEHRINDVANGHIRVDCLTDTHAWEVDFAKKWGECIGQAQYYAQLTGRRPGCLLILRGDEGRFFQRAVEAGPWVEVVPIQRTD